MDLNIDLKNLKIEDIKEKLLKLADKKTLIKIGIGAGAVIIFLIIYYAVLNPIVNKKKVQLDDMNKKKQETTELIQKIKSKQKKMNKLSFLVTDEQLKIIEDRMGDMKERIGRKVSNGEILTVICSI